MFNNQTVLVTGGSGLVGSAFKSISIDPNLKYSLNYNFEHLDQLFDHHQE